MDRQLAKATRQHTREHNSSLVLRTIYDNNEISRAELARLTKLTRTTVSDVVTSLIERGLVVEVGPGTSTGGRTPMLLSVLDDARHLIGVHLRSNDLCGATINLRGGIRRRVQRTIPSGDSERVLPLICDLIDELIASATSPLLGIGVSTPGLIDMTAGIVRRAVNFGWQDLPLREILRARYQLPVYLGNDAHMAALAEYTFGASQNRQNLVVIRAGQGIGAGIILNGRLYHGHDYGAGEIGHIVVAENGIRCKCGNFGCLETVAGTGQIVRRAQQIAAEHPESALHRYAPDIARLDLDAVVRACADGDEAVRKLVAEVGRYLGAVLAGLVGILNVERIVISGQVARFGEPLREAAVAEMARRALPTLVQRTEVAVVEESPDAVLLGISALLLNYELVLQRHLVGAPLREG